MEKETAGIQNGRLNAGELLFIPVFPVLPKTNKK